MINAIFDLDGTLYTGHVARGLTRHHRAHRINRLPLYAYFAAHMPLWWLYRARLMSKETMNLQWAKHMGWTVRGMTVERAARAFEWIAAEYAAPRVRPDVMARLREHQDAGHRVILVSGTFSPLLAIIGQQFGIEETVGTPLVTQNGRYTGASEQPVCQGIHKVTRLLAYLGEDPGAHWLDSYAYADSYTDIPLLEQFGHPVAVYPDADLKAHAQQKGWEIFNPLDKSLDLDYY
jgi:HAD superfamily hydrolase (TIGR01490 family)